jgi:branched-chain amino acid aminotransferase
MAEGFYTVDDLLKADELFLTNAFYGIRWVKQLREKHYSCEQSAKLFQQFIRPLF